jgi:GT2 family glycosyltransferase
MKTLIAIPAMNQVPTQFAASLAVLQKDENTVIGWQISSLVYLARNTLAKAAIEMGADYVLWLDSDMTFEPDTLIRLLKDHEEKRGDIISGLYFKRVPPYTPVLYEVFEAGETESSYLIQTKIPDGFFEVQACGFGCVLTPVEVIRAVAHEYGAPFTQIKGNGEDLSFCWRARQLGYKIVVDPSISCGHVGYQVITRSFYDKFVSFGGLNE